MPLRYQTITIGLIYIKVHKFLEGHKILRNLHQSFDWQYWQIIGGDLAKFCGLLRIYELYLQVQWRSSLCSATTSPIMMGKSLSPISSRNSLIISLREFEQGIGIKYVCLWKNERTFEQAPSLHQCTELHTAHVCVSEPLNRSWLRYYRHMFEICAIVNE